MGGEVPSRTDVSLTAEVTSRSFSITRGRLERDPWVGTGVSTSSRCRGVFLFGDDRRGGETCLSSSIIGSAGDMGPPCPAAFAFPFPRDRPPPEATDAEDAASSLCFPLLRLPFEAALSTERDAAGVAFTVVGAGF